MLKPSDLKLYRKFLILAVLLGVLYFTLAPGPAASAKSHGFCEPPMYYPCCCSTCLERATQCMWDNCGNLQYGPPGYLAEYCNQACNDEQYECRLYCDGLC
jgi:hypothetical protein